MQNTTVWLLNGVCVLAPENTTNANLCKPAHPRFSARIQREDCSTEFQLQVYIKAGVCVCVCVCVWLSLTGCWEESVSRYCSSHSIVMQPISSGLLLAQPILTRAFLSHTHTHTHTHLLRRSLSHSESGVSLATPSSCTVGRNENKENSSASRLAINASSKVMYSPLDPLLPAGRLGMCVCVWTDDCRSACAAASRANQTDYCNHAAISRAGLMAALFHYKTAALWW